jgi:hypothetical protein
MMSICSSALYARAFRRTVAAAGVAIGGSHAHRDQDVVGDRGSVAQRLQACTAALVAVLVIAACSSDDTASPGTTTSASSVAPSTTGTSSSASTTSTSTSTATTTAPPTTIDARLDARLDAESKVRAAVADGYAAFSACLVAMPACDTSTLAAVRAGDLLQQNVDRIAEWNAAGYTVRDRDQFRFVIESVTLADAALTQATVVTCIADGSKLVQPAAGPNGVDVLVDGAYTSGRDEIEMRLDSDGVWRAYSGRPIGPTEARDVCPAG